MVLEKNTAYKAALKLSWIESIASNEIVAKEFIKIGFTNVRVTGSGQNREASGTWTGATQEVNTIPKQVTNIRKI
ncbi:MAG: hypothetical protein QY309_04800 [Cyclobacteriaceae bacterium]|nr:MAG: hypothetical protein QY309_04800 [Cyclobacteriaceae bacterium]